MRRQFSPFRRWFQLITLLFFFSFFICGASLFFVGFRFSVCLCVTSQATWLPVHASCIFSSYVCMSFSLQYGMRLWTRETMISLLPFSAPMSIPFLLPVHESMHTFVVYERNQLSYCRHSVRVTFGCMSHWCFYGNVTGPRGPHNVLHVAAVPQP